MPISLTVVEGPHAGRSFTFDGHDTFLVGRSPDVHFSLPDKDRFFSRVHFLVEVNPPLCKLVDLKSHNGTSVNGERVSEKELHDGDLIKAGHTVMRVALIGVDAPNSAAPNSFTRSRFERTATLTPNGGGPVTADPVPGYTLVRELGRGGMGVVSLAVQDATGIHVALKTIRPAYRPDPASLGRFLREAQILEELNHPNIVGCLDSGEADGVLYFAMEYVDGQDAASLVKTSGPLPIPRAVTLACQLLDALEFAHAKGFVHRDVKPGNLLVAPQSDGGEIVKLADFGLARTYQATQMSGLTLAGKSGGTPYFMPPEQALDFRGVKPPADLYSASASLYYLLTGKYVYDSAGDLAQLFASILSKDPVPVTDRRPDIPPPLAAAVHRALRRKPEERFRDAREFRLALEPFARG